MSSSKSVAFKTDKRQLYTLSNGCRVVICRKPQLASAHVGVYFLVGSRDELAGENGLTHVLEHMLFRGTGSYRDSTALNRAAEDIGGFLEGATYRDHMLLETGCHKGGVEKAISILGEMVTTPRYRSMDVEREIIREEVIGSLNREGKQIDVDNICHQLCFGSRGLGQAIEGTLDNLNAFDVDTLERFKQRWLVSSNCVVAVSGDVDCDATLESMETSFGGLLNVEPGERISPRLPRSEPVCRFVKDPSSQVDFRLSFRSHTIGEQNYPAQAMLARVLADGMASRMYSELIEKRGLAYSLSAGALTYSDVGLFDFDFTVAPEKAVDTVEAVLQFAKSARRLRYRDEELQRALRRYRFGMEFMNDSASELAGFFGRSQLFGIDQELSQLPQHFERVSSSDLRAVAKEIFAPAGMALVGVGELPRGAATRLRQMVSLFR